MIAFYNENHSIKKPFHPRQEIKPINGVVISKGIMTLQDR